MGDDDGKEALKQVQLLASDEKYEEASKLALEILENHENGDVTASLPSHMTNALIRFYTHSLFHVDNNETTALEYVRKLKKDNNDYDYAAEEAYCYYRLKKYDKAQQICEKALGVNGEIDFAAAGSSLALLHVYAQTLYRNQNLKAAIRVYQHILKLSNDNNSCEENDELLVNLVAVYCSFSNHFGEIFMELADTSPQIANIMEHKQTQIADCCADLAFNIATLLAIHGSHPQDAELAASILLQTQQMIKAKNTEEEKSSPGNSTSSSLIAELTPMQCNYAYALLRQSTATPVEGDANYQQKSRLAEVFWNKVVANSRGASSSSAAAALVAQHNLSILKASSFKNILQTEEESQQRLSDLGTNTAAAKLLLPMQLFIWLKNKAIMYLLANKTKEFETTVRELRKIARANTRSINTTYCVDAIVLEVWSLQLEHGGYDSNIIIQKIDKALEDAKKIQDTWAILSLLLFQAQLSVNSGNISAAIQYMEQLQDNSGTKGLPAIVATLVAMYGKMTDDTSTAAADTLLEDIFFTATAKDFSSFAENSAYKFSALKEKADYLLQMGKSNSAAQIYEFLLQHVDEEEQKCYYQSCVACLIQASLEKDPKKAQELAALLPDDLYQQTDKMNVIIDPEELEERELPRFQRIRKPLLTSGTSSNGSASKEE